MTDTDDPSSPAGDLPPSTLDSGGTVPEDGGGDIWPHGHVGYVALFGRPNVGKSTLLNSLLEHHIAPVSAKPQTTRRRCLGVLCDEEAQLVFLDTPGLHRSRNLLDEAMAKTIRRAVGDADLVLCLADCTRAPGDEDAMVAQVAHAEGKPTVVAINKADLGTPEQVSRSASFFSERLPDAQTFVIAAVDRGSLDPLVLAMKQALPTGPFLYPPDTLTDSFERDIGAELIREALLESLRQEVPHSMAVTIDAWKEEPGRRRVDAVLHVERSQHKGIVIGQGGRTLKAIRARAAGKLSELCQCPVSLRLWVKIDRDWRTRPVKVREFGYHR